VQGPGERFRAEVEAAGEPHVQLSEGTTVVTVPLGTGSPLRCFVYADSIDAGATLRDLIERVRSNPQLQVQMVRTTEIVAVNETPALYMELAYTTGEPPRRLGGHVKMMVYPSTVDPVVCMQDEAGYSATFRRITEGFVASLTPAKPEESPRFVDLHVARVQNQPVGFVWYTGNRDAKGQVRTNALTTMVMPRSATDLVFLDTVQATITNAKGQLQSVEYAKVENGELSVRISAERKGSLYAYSGQHSGKDVKGTFRAKGRAGLVDEPATSTAVRERLLSGKAKELKFEMYVPGVDPQAPVDVVYSKSDAGPSALSLKMAALELTGRADDNGLVDRVELPMGAVSLVQERIFTRGMP
jgi:hypothetical protein